ncbi:alcohol dehydrogenase catalytic domain-containing protein, partial [bacterium]|nr:alcohol dehydrogenase catalytic domain-containing protein [bacterium]
YRMSTKNGIDSTRIVGTVWNGVYYSSISPVSFGDLKEGPLPSPGWISVKNILSGICGTDLSVFFLELNPKISLAALPGLSRVFLGHEICGEVVDVGPEVTRLRLGDRVALQRSLPCCFAKEIEPRCQQCQQGNYGLCENQSEGSFPSNLGGGWSELFLAHESQLVPVPDEISNEEAVLIEPAAVALHAILRKEPQVNDKVLIVGAGIIGLLILHTIKQLQPGCQVSVIARHNYQQKMAKELEADRILVRHTGIITTCCFMAPVGHVSIYFRSF